MSGAGPTTQDVTYSAEFQAALGAFGFTSFRPGQLEALEALRRHRRLLLIAPTGGGKSLIYQLPATMLPGTTLVISPLISLMHDQVQALTAKGIAATYLASTLGDEESWERLRGIRDGRFRLVYVAPERLPFPGFRELVRSIGCPLVAIDEAHCVSQWGHDFRPEYLQIRDFLREHPASMVLACTATATPVVRDDIIRQLGLGADTPQIVRGFARPNLSLRARTVEGTGERCSSVDAALRDALGSPSSAAGGAILYCLSRKDAETEARRLREDGWRAGWYHAGLSGEHRAQVQGRFMRGDLDVVAATNAFGMGIDRADVRTVIHLAPPDSVEAYYQEVGRAGRDGRDATGLLLLRTADIPRRRSLLERSALENGTPRALFEHRWEMFLDLIRWAEGGSCRHDAILRYFGDEAETLHGCGRCDVCRQLSGGGARLDEEESVRIVRTVLGAVGLVHERLGLKATIKFLRGEKDDRLERARLLDRPSFGALSGETERWLSQVLQRCVTAGWVGFTDGEYALLVLTDAGQGVLAGIRPARLLLPARVTEDDRDGARPRRARGRAAGGRGGAAADAAGIDDGSWDEELFQKLRLWRREEAASREVPAYVIASDRTLQDIAARKPTTIADLKLCHGIGPQKAEQFGEAILGVVRS